MASIPIPFIGGGGDGSDDCTATASDVLEGKTAIYNGSDDEPAEGSMKDYSGTTQSATASLDSSNNRVQMAVPNTGKYDTAARLYSSFSNLANTIDLTADMIASGSSVLGIKGTARVFTYTTGSETFSSVTRTAWVTEDGTTHRFGSFSIRDIGFTPVFVFGHVGGGAVLADSNGANIICSMAADDNWTERYPAENNSDYSLTESLINIPLYSATDQAENNFYYTIVGYK